MKKYLIACLGNIGAEYANTRHNIGFLVADKLAKDHNASFTTQKLGDLAEIKVKGRTFILLKPSTYMNLSGKAVRYWLEKENIPLENLLCSFIERIASITVLLNILKSLTPFLNSTSLNALIIL